MNCPKGVVQRGKNTYRFTVSSGFDGNGKHIRKTTTFKVPEGTAPTKAQKLVSAAYKEFSDRCEGMKNLNENMRFKDLVEIYFKVYAPNELKPATRYNYKKDLARHMLPVFGNKMLKDITIADMSNFFTSLDLAPASTRKMRTITSSVFSFEVGQGYTKGNPCLNALYKKSGLKDIEMLAVESENYYTKSQCRELLSLMGDYSTFNVIIKFLLFTGMRVGECLSLTWKDIDFENDIIHIKKTLTYADKVWFTTTPKTRKSNRKIKMSKYVRELLLTHREKQNELKAIVGSSWVYPDVIFTSLKGKYYDKSYLNTKLKKFVNKNNLPKITLHGLRHTNASLMIFNGADVTAVSKRLGHCNIGVTGDIYTHIFDEYDAKITNAIDKDLI